LGAEGVVAAWRHPRCTAMRVSVHHSPAAQAYWTCLLVRRLSQVNCRQLCCFPVTSEPIWEITPDC
jgi:hypothetical protein